MQVKVETCWNGHAFYFRLTIPVGKYARHELQLRVPGDEWNRITASEALDLLAVELPQVSRRSIRFVHV